MSATVEVPRGLDVLTPDEQKLMESMRDDSPAPDEAAPPAASPVAPLSTETTEDFEVDIPDEPPPVTDRRQTTVPQQALHAEREKRKAAEKLAAERETALAALKTEQEKKDAVLQARLDMIAKAMETAPTPVAATPVVAPPAEEPLPDKTTDPIGYFEALTGRLQKTVETQGAMLTGFTEAQRRAQETAELRNWGVSQELAFEAQEPSYRDAMAWLRQSRNAELEKIGVTDAAERDRIIGSDVNAIAVRARQETLQGRPANFAQRLYDAAVSRGYQKVAPVAAAPAAPVIPPLDAPATPDEDRALRLAAARENATTIGSLGSAPPVRLSAQKIADMPEKEFAVLYERIKDNPAALRQLMGD